MLEKLIWESNFFNKLIYTINLNNFSSHLLKEEIKKINFSLIQTKINSKDISKINELLKFGFKIESISSTFEKDNIGNKCDNYRYAK